MERVTGNLMPLWLKVESFFYAEIDNDKSREILLWD